MPGLEPLELPADIAYLLGWFSELSAASGSGGFGASPIGYAEILAWAHLTRRTPTPFEIDVLRRIDSALLAVMNEPEDV
jgi:hypothetical protein